jgi:hypothetical protein
MGSSPQAVGLIHVLEIAFKKVRAPSFFKNTVPPLSIYEILRPDFYLSQEHIFLKFVIDFDVKRDTVTLSVPCFF